MRLRGGALTKETYSELDWHRAPFDVQLVGRLAVLGLDVVTSWDQTVGAENDHAAQSTKVLN